MYLRHVLESWCAKSSVSLKAQSRSRMEPVIIVTGCIKWVEVKQVPKKINPTKIVENVHKVFSEKQNMQGGNQMRLVSWVINGKPTPVRLERREYYIKGEQGQRINGKAKGFTYEDILFIEENIEEIKELMERTTYEKKETIKDAEEAIEQEERAPWGD